MHNTNQFMVDFTLPNALTPEFMSLMPKQKERVDLLFTEGVLDNYMLSMEDHKLWAVFNANSEYDVMQLVAALPLTQFMETKISMLTMSSTPKGMPGFCLN